jgi:transcriptional regulator with XRE-family HTH domain
MNLRSRRKAAGLTQWELAVKAHRSPFAVCRYENGKRPSYQAAKRLAEALNCRVCDLWPGATLYGSIEIPNPEMESDE